MIYLTHKVKGPPPLVMELDMILLKFRPNLHLQTFIGKIQILMSKLVKKMANLSEQQETK